MVNHNLRRLIRRKVPSNCLHKITFRIYALSAFIPLHSHLVKLTHQIKVNTVIHEIILARLDTTRRAKVHAVRLAHVLDLFVRARQADKVRVKLVQIVLEHLRLIARRVACNHDREQDSATLLDYFVVHEGHFVEFVRANVGAVGEAEIHLSRYC